MALFYYPTSHRDLFRASLGLFVVTLGSYAVYWYYSTLKELHIANGKDEGAGLWTVLALIPIANLFSWWHYSSEADTFTSGKYSSVVLFIVWIIFSPIVWLLVQMELNKAAKGETRQQTVFQNP